MRMPMNALRFSLTLSGTSIAFCRKIPASTAGVASFERVEAGHSSNPDNVFAFTVALMYSLWANRNRVVPGQIAENP